MNANRLLVGAAALFLAVSAWAPVVIVSTHPDNVGHINRNPEIAVDASGNSYITWWGYDGNDDEIYWVKVDSSQIAGTVKKISTHPDCEDNIDVSPHIAVDASGNSYIVWRGSDGNDTDIYWTKIDASGTQKTVKKISTHEDNIDHDDFQPDIAVDASGNSYIVWQGSDRNDMEIYWTKIDASGTQKTVKISTHEDNIDDYDTDPRIAIDILGNSYVVWHGCKGEKCDGELKDLEIYWVKIDASGVLGIVKKVPSTFPDNINTTAMVPQFAVDPSGSSCIVWSGKVGGSYNLYWVKIDSLGTMSTIKEISACPDSDCDSYDSCIAVDISGNSYVVWEGFDGENREVYWVNIDASGMQGTVKMISQYLGSTLYEDTNPEIVVDASKNSYIVWESFNRGWAEQFDKQICWVKIDSSGTPGRVDKISSRQFSKHFDRSPRIAVDASGTCYVVWEGDDEYNNDHIFFTARLPNSTPMIIIVVIAAITALLVLAVVRRRLGKNRLKPE